MSDIADYDECPVCGDKFVNGRKIVPKKARGSKTGVDAVEVRRDYSACREKRTMLRESATGFKEYTVVLVFIHGPSGEKESKD